MTESLEQTESYFASIGYQLQAGDDESVPWSLVDRTGWVWDEDFQTLAELWAAWLAEVAYRLREELKLSLFTAAYEAADVKHRAELIDALTDYVAIAQTGTLTQLFLPANEISADNLPDDWQQRLARNFDSWIDGRGFNQTVFEVILRMDPSALHGWTSERGGLLWRPPAGN